MDFPDPFSLAIHLYHPSLPASPLHNIIYVYIYYYTCVYISMHTFMHILMCKYIYEYIDVCLYPHIYRNMLLCIDICMNIMIYIYIYIHTYIFIYEVHTISFQTFFIWALLLIVHTWNSSPLQSNLLRLQCTCCTIPTTSGRPHRSPLGWACQCPLSQPLSSL